MSNSEDVKRSSEWLEEKLKHCNGQDCNCYAYGQHECGCDADWTPKEVYVLQSQLSAERELRGKAEKTIKSLLDFMRTSLTSIRDSQGYPEKLAGTMLKGLDEIEQALAMKESVK